MARASTTGASDAPGNVRRLPGPRSRGALRRPRSHPEKNYGHSLRPCIAWCSRPRKRATSPGTSLPHDVIDNDADGRGPHVGHTGEVVADALLDLRRDRGNVRAVVDHDVHLDLVPDHA